MTDFEEMDEGAQAFVLESRELLDSVETTLLKLEESPDDADLIDELFRNIHTIKGSAGLFGYEKVVSFTHHAESVMDRVREGEINLDYQLISLLLKSRDHMEVLVAEAINKKAMSDEERQVDLSLSKALHEYLDEEESESEISEGNDGEWIDSNFKSKGSHGKNIESIHTGNENWHISLRFNKNVLRYGMDPLSFFKYLPTVGDIVHMVTLSDKLPPLAEMGPLDCYLGFEIELRSKARKEEIAAVFEFVQDDCTLHILAPYAQVISYMQMIENLPEDNILLGEILLRSGALTENELKEALQLQSKARQEKASEPGQAPIAPLGEVAVEQGMVSETVVKSALEKQEKNKEAIQTQHQTIRVNAEKLASLINFVGELAISSAHAELKCREQGDPSLIESVEIMSRLVDEVRDSTMSLRMVQIGETFNRFKRVVRDLGEKSGKRIDLVISGGDTELDKVVVEKLSDPLMHLIRNAADHGLETPQERADANKDDMAQISISAHHDSGSIIIEIEDNGRGLNREKIVQKAMEKGLITSDRDLSDRDANRLIFTPGFSTADEVTNISGRGVGMDVVKRNIDALRGQIEVLSTVGEGTKFIVRLPLTLAIIDGFQVMVGNSSYVIPLDMVDECIELNATPAQHHDGGDYVDLRGNLLPYIRLANKFNEKDHSAVVGHRDNIVVVKYAGQKVGLVVDELLGEHQTVIKPLGPVFKKLPGFSGATILGSGEVAMIVDVGSLVRDIVTLHSRRSQTVAMELSA